ncbi:MAG: M4 family metallopeptidase, partial [Desulfobulbales bacterium]
MARQEDDNDQEYSVTGIGIEKAEQIAYRNLSYYLTRSSQYFDARNGALQAAEDLHRHDILHQALKFT